MEPIINPMFFYWLSVVDNLRGISIGFMISSLIVLVILGVVYICSIGTDFLDENGKKAFKTIMIFSIIICILFSILLIFVPSKDTLIEMVIAQNLTTNNIEAGIEAVKGVTDYIIEAIKGLE